MVIASRSLVNSNQQGEGGGSKRSYGFPGPTLYSIQVLLSMFLNNWASFRELSDEVVSAFPVCFSHASSNFNWLVKKMKSTYSNVTTVSKGFVISLKLRGYYF